ncbi:hypothetical protein [Nonomuraea glycinis]|uniref:hypothetical protein n=1 Tax=Nonomuraea glycinis TaxID=2047744 RepID=UPI002E0F63C3|nr:hypothetical protein OHA68_11205 [Nonomuraea glycinis]
MLAMQLAALAEDPPGAAEALELVTAFDEALANGLGRLDERGTQAITGLAGAVAATPLGDRAREAAEKIAAGSVAGEHLTALAGARAALLGAVHDALLTHLDDSLGRTRATWPPTPAEGSASVGGAGAAMGNLLIGCRSWLHELAITGWRGVGHDLASAADQAIEAVLAEPGLRRLAVLTDGLAGELRASSPVAAMEKVPVRRWADLWTRAVLLSEPDWLGTPEQVELVSGRLLILGVDVHEHATVVQAQVHAVLESAGGEARVVRAAVSAGKVDTIVGPAIWSLLEGYPVLTGALAGGRSVEITDMPLLGGGDLVWQEDRAAPQGAADPFATARVMLAGALAPATPPLDRHPARIAEPVFLEGYTTAKTGDRISLDGHDLAVAVDRLPSSGPLTPKLMATSTACVGLLRWDAGRWLLQPLAIQATVKKQPVEEHTGAWAQGPTDPKVVRSLARAGDAVTVLRERAGRLLRR